VGELVDSYRDPLSGATDVYLSTVANRQGEINKQLTVIATIFLPLTLHHRVLRPELRLHDRPHNQHHLVISGLRTRSADRLDNRLPDLLPAQEVDVDEPPYQQFGGF
jgi:CorA-like Mg2+ transporter protein